MKVVYWSQAFEPSKNILQSLFDRQEVEYVEHLFREIGGLSQKLMMNVDRGVYNCLDIKLLQAMFIVPQIKDKKICFLYNRQWADRFMKIGLIEVLRKKYPYAKHVLSLEDIQAARKYDINRLKECFDDICIYDQEEANKMGISYLPPTHSKIYEIPEDNVEEYDLFFVGHAKNRLNEIQNICKFLSAHGLKLFIYITGVEKDRRQKIDGIIYGDKILPSEEAFRFLAKSKCLLELELFESHAATARYREAIIYDKKVLTNNPTLRTDEYYKPSMVQIYEKIDQIDCDFFRSPKESFSYSGDFEPSNKFFDYLLKICEN